MDRVNLLRKLVESERLGRLSICDVKLLLLMLSHCGEVMSGELSHGEIRRVLGSHYSWEEIEASCNNLNRHGFIQAQFSGDRKSMPHEIILRFEMTIEK